MKPDTTFIAARILGPLLIAIGVALINQPLLMFAAAREYLSNDSLRILGAVVGISMGLTLGVLHTRWNGVTATLVTLIAWITAARGAILLLAPSLERDVLIVVGDNQNILPIAGCVMALIGVWLAYAGYISGTLRVEAAPNRLSVD